jgi:hypothetical protein
MLAYDAARRGPNHPAELDPRGPWVIASRGARVFTVFNRNPKIEEAPLQGELMLFDPDSAKFYVLNRTMAFVWRRCDGYHSPEAMLESLRQEFAEVDAASADKDLRAALDELVSLGLVFDSARAAPVT